MRGIAKVVTGGGKTVFAGMCIQAYISNFGGQVVIVVPTKALRDQWHSILNSNWGIPLEEIATSRDEAEEGEWSVLLLVLNTAREVVPMLSCQPHSMLIVDECHRAGSGENRKSMHGSWQATLGLSATPERQYDDFFETVLQPSLGNIIIDYDYSSASEDGVISGFTLTNHRVEFTESEATRYEDLTKKIIIEAHYLETLGLRTSEKLEKLLMARARVSKNAVERLPVAVELVESALPRKTILFHENIQHVEALSMALQSRG